MAVLQDSFSASDIDRVEARMRQNYGTVRLTDSRTRMTEQTVTTPRFFANRVTFVGSFSVLAEFRMLTTVISSGEYRWAVDGEQGEAKDVPFLIRPDLPMSADCGDGDMFAFSFDPAALEPAARAFYGDDSLAVRFDSSAPVDGAHARYYRELLRHADASLALLPESELLQATLHRTMTVGVLECFALHGDPVVRRETVRSLQSGYRRAKRFIDDHASLPITIEDIAVAASLTVGQLEAAFAAHSPKGTTATEELRRVRIAAAHADLVAGDPSRGDTVRAIALRWGWSPSRFAELYRAAHGVPPRATLKGERAKP